MTKLAAIKRIGDEAQRALQQAGVEDCAELMARAATRAGRRKLAAESGLSEKELLAFANRLDLQRIHGIGQEYSDLLDAAGVDSVLQLARRQASTLYKKLLTLNHEECIVRRMPPAAKVGEWIAEAKTLEPRISH